MKYCQLCSENIQHTWTATPSQARSQTLCEYCLVRLPVLTSACERCGSQRCVNHQPHHKTDNTLCQATSLSRDRTFSPFHYRFPMDMLIQRFKYQKQLSVLDTLAQQMILHLKRQPHLVAHIDGVIPVPLHPKKIKERGFNQCFWLAKRLCQALKLPLMDTLCLRTLNTKPQSQQSAQQRRSNLQHAFKLNEGQLKNTTVLKKHIVIVDDVITTGATTEAMAKLLKHAGAQTISVWTLASAYG